MIFDDKRIAYNILSAGKMIDRGYRVNEDMTKLYLPEQDVKKARKKIEGNKAFKKLFQDTGEDYGYALEIWLEDNGDEVGVESTEDAQELIDKLSESNEEDCEAALGNVE